MVIKKTYTKKGYLRSVSNTVGKKKDVQIGLGLKGWNAVYAGSYRRVKGIKPSKSAEALAGRLAKKGHKRATILD